MAQLERPQRQDMAQLERPQRQDDAPKAPTIHTMEQLLRAGDVSKPKLSSPRKSATPSPSSAGSSPSSPFFPRMRHHDSEEDHGQNQKKSVLAKVKEKAKKLRHSLSKKKDGNSTSPSWGAGQEGDGAEDDAEYHRAPMYESEKAPEYQENARQHQRGSPIFPQKHVPGGREQAREKTLSRSLSKKTSQTTIPTNAAAATNSTFSGPMKILTKPAPEKASAEGSETWTPHAITTKLQALALSKPVEHHNSSSTTAPSKTYKSSVSFGASHTPSGLRISSGPNPMASPPPSPPSSAPSRGNNTSPASQVWDKGVSVKEYLMNKFEPGEDEKALSNVISETMSPRRTPGDVGVIEKVREAVTSLLQTGETKKHADTNTTTTTSTSSQIPASTNTTRTSSHIPVSSNAQEVDQEENHGRVLQAN